MSEYQHQWYISTPIEEGELLSSWLIRAALNAGCSPLVLIEALWGNWRALTIDLDKNLSEKQLSILLRHSFETEENIRNTLLCSGFHKIHNKNYIGQNALWILSLGSRNRSNLAGRQICSKCFIDDKNNPYLRLKWRMAWHTCCEKHNVRLIDKCDNCHVTIHPHKVEIEHKSLSICTKCGFDLKKAHAMPAEQSALAFQKQADQVFEQGYGYYDGEKISSIEWFAIARSWLSEIRMVINSKNKKLINMFEALGLQISTSILTPITFENLNNGERIYLISMLYKIMNTPCEKIILYSHKFEINQSNFWDNRQVIHPILNKMKICIKAKSKRVVSTRCRSFELKPKDKKSVQKKWINFLRKYNEILEGSCDRSK